MVSMMSTKVTKAGQTSVPKEIRTALGIVENTRVYWFWDGERAYISALPTGAPTVKTKDEFFEGLKEAEEQDTIPASAVSAEIRVRYGAA